MPDFELEDDDQAVGKLQSAIYTPMQPYYRTIYDKAACLFRSIVKNHALKDGNKRLGVIALDVFLNTNGVDLKASQDELVHAALTIARHEGNFPLEAITAWIRGNCVGRPRGFVKRLVEQWEESSRKMMIRSRQDDIKAGRPARIPGRRVKVPRKLKESYGPLKGLRGGKVILRGGPRDGELVNLPFLADEGVVATGVHPEDVGIDPSKQRRVAYVVVDEQFRRRRVAQFVEVRAPGR